MQKFILVIFLLNALCSLAQKTPDPKSFANTITAEDLKKHLYIVAGSEMEGRETATEGQRKAATYIEDYFKSLGLLPGLNGSFQMNYPLYQDSLVHSSIEVNGKSFQLFRDFAVNLTSSNGTMLMGSEIVFAGYGYSDSTRDDYKDINARGKIVLVLPGIPPSGENQRRGGGQLAIQEAALKNGAVAILSVQLNFPRNATSLKGPMYYTGFRKTIYPNIITISEQVAREIMGSEYDAAKESMAKGNAQPKSYPAEVMIEVNKMVSKLSSSNVIGYIEGTDKKDEYPCSNSPL